MKNLKYVITTIAKYEKAKKILEESLLSEGIDEKDIIYIYSKCNEYKIETNNKNQICVYLKTNFFEYSGIYGIYKLFLSDKKYLNYNYLLMHDTCKALKGFKNKSISNNNTLVDQKKDIFWAHRNGRHNIGIFNAKAIIFLTKSSIIPLFKLDFDKTYAIKMEWDLVPQSLHLNRLLKHLYTNENTLLPKYRSTIYSIHRARDIAIFESLNLVKYYIQLGPIKNKIGNLHPNSLE
jgi:hypothetical protein